MISIVTNGIIQVTSDEHHAYDGDVNKLGWNLWNSKSSQDMTSVGPIFIKNLGWSEALGMIELFSTQNMMYFYGEITGVITILKFQEFFLIGGVVLWVGSQNTHVVFGFVYSTGWLSKVFQIVGCID